MSDMMSATPDWDKVKATAVRECLDNRPAGMSELEALQRRADELKNEFDSLTDHGSVVYSQAAEEAARIEREAKAQADAIMAEAARKVAAIQSEADRQAEAARDRTPVALLEKLAIEMEIQNRTLGQ